MAIVVQPPRGIAESLGTGLSEGLSLLAQNKLKEISQRNQARGLEALGLNPNQASSLSLLEPQVQQIALKQLLSGPQQETYAQLVNQLLGGEASPLPSGARLNEKQTTQLAKLGLQKQAMQTKEQARIDKETKPIYDEITKEARSAQNTNKKLARIEELTNKGSLGIPLFNSAIKTLSKGIFGFGIDLPFLMTADAQELDKLSTDLIREAKDIFGSRLTDADLNAFMRTIPTLSQSKAGRLAVIKNMKAFNEGKIVRKQAADAIIKANKGIRPRDLDMLVEEAVQPALDQIASKFSVPEPEKESTLSKLAGHGNIKRDLRNLGLIS